MARTLAERAAAVRNRLELAAFLRALVHDWEMNPTDWENLATPGYLEAMAAWLQDAEGYYRNTGQTMPDQPTWQLLGQVLLAAKKY